MEVRVNRVDFDCSICMCDVEGPVVTRCGHLFCWNCLYGWSEKSSICPVCKSLCSLSTVIPIYSKGANVSAVNPPLREVTRRMKSVQEKRSFGFPADLRVFHMQGIEYRGNIYSKQCILTKIFYIVLLLLFIMVFLLLE